MKGLLVVVCILLGLILLVLCGVPPWGVALIVVSTLILVGIGSLIRMLFNGARQAPNETIMFFLIAVIFGGILLLRYGASWI